MDSQRTGDAGEFLVGEKVSRLGFRWQPMPGAPYFDGEIQLFNVAAGAAIKAQVKTRGKFALRPSGLRYYGEADEVVQWTNANQPVVLILVDDRSRMCYWQEIRDDTVVRAAKNFKIDVPLSNDLDKSRKALIDLATKDFVPLSHDHVRELMSRWSKHPSWRADVEVWSFVGRVAQPPTPRTIKSYVENREIETVLAIGLEMDPGSGQTHFPQEIPGESFRASAGDFVGLLYVKDEHRRALLGAINLTATYPPWSDGMSEIDRYFPEYSKAVAISLGISALVGAGAAYELHNILWFMGGMFASTLCFTPYLRRSGTRLRRVRDYLTDILTSLRDDGA